MQHPPRRSQVHRRIAVSAARQRGKLFAGLGLIALLACSVQRLHSQSASQLDPNRPYLVPEANRLPDANDQMKLHEQQTRKQSFEAANVERKKQIADDSTRLLKLATDLKAEVDKTNKDTLSLSVIRKADEIEKLAHNVKEKMKLTVASN